MWKALRLAGEDVGRGHVERLMREHGGAKRRGKPWRTTTPDPMARRRPDLVERVFSASAPDALWVADIERHEALFDRVEVRNLGGPSVAAGGSKLGAA